MKDDKKIHIPEELESLYFFGVEPILEFPEEEAFYQRSKYMLHNSSKERIQFILYPAFTEIELHVLRPTGETLSRLRIETIQSLKYVEENGKRLLLDHSDDGYYRISEIQLDPLFCIIQTERRK